MDAPVESPGEQMENPEQATIATKTRSYSIFAFT